MARLRWPLLLVSLIICICIIVAFQTDRIPLPSDLKNDISEYIPDSIGEYVGIGDAKPSETGPQPHAAAETRTPAQLPHNFEQPYIKLNHLEVTPQYERPLITYAYHETDFARKNLEFFVQHGLHAAADFVFIFNGDTDADKIVFADPLADIPKDIRHLIPARPLDNVYVKKRPNTCFDMGAHAEILNSAVGEGDGWYDKNGRIKKARGQKLRDSHKRFILMNSSIRGPFLPPWSNDCWSDAYLNKLTAKTKLIGMAYNCHSLVGHVQSMIWATDKTGIDLILTKDGIGECFAEIGRAMDAEVRTTKLLRDNGYEVDAFLQIYHSEDKEAKYARMRAKMNAGKEQFKRVPDVASKSKDIKKRNLGLYDLAKAHDAKEAADEHLKKRNHDLYILATEQEVEILATQHEVEEEAAQRNWQEIDNERLRAGFKAVPTSMSDLEVHPEHYPISPKIRHRDASPPPPPSPSPASEATKPLLHPDDDISAQTQDYDAQLLSDENGAPGYMWRECKEEDWLGPHSYAGSFVHPYENLFIKSHRGIADHVLGNLTEWVNGQGTNSWDVCL